MDGVESFGILLGKVPKLDGAKTKSAFLDALDDFADKPRLNGVGLDDGERGLHIRPIISRSET
jgi:hypothetical protein